MRESQIFEFGGLHKSSFSDATLMISICIGSFVSTVLKNFLSSDIGEIRIFSRDEKKQDDIRHEL